MKINFTVSSRHQASPTCNASKGFLSDSQVAPVKTTDNYSTLKVWITKTTPTSQTGNPGKSAAVLLCLFLSQMSKSTDVKCDDSMQDQWGRVPWLELSELGSVYYPRLLSSFACCCGCGAVFSPCRYGAPILNLSSIYFATYEDFPSPL